MRQIFYLYFLFPKTQMRPLFSSLKKDRRGEFETDEGGPEKLFLVSKYLRIKISGII